MFFQIGKTNKSGQGSLVALVLGGVVLTTIVASATSWYLSMNKTMNGTNDRLEAMTIAMSEWQRLEHMSLDELEDNRENYKTPYNVGDKFKVGINLGEQGFFDEGKCNSLTGTYAGENANCFKDTIMTVYDKDGSAMYTTRSLPLSVGGASIPEGTIWPYTGDLAKIPHGWVLCDGTNGTPDLTGRFLEGTKTTTGEFKMAGLPNITGDWEDWIGYQYPKTSNKNAFYTDGVTHQRASQDAGYYGYLYMYFDASRSNPIYGRSDTVQPPSYTVFYIMKTNTDFHYNHTNPADTPSFYTKEEVDTLLSGTKKDYNNKVDNLTGRLNGNEFIKNYTPSYNLNLRYLQNAEDDNFSLYAYNGDTKIPFSQEGASWDLKKFPHGPIVDIKHATRERQEGRNHFTWTVHVVTYADGHTVDVHT